ncbi:hypothetical protein COU79_05360 [Candidatus Peregrinibacteria bacterium CG10_big_fil_rev_8_21_14_0_10_54_7]|nr:MAG: hypothetical protein COU79_05360 [Candidatus Peregrinibacteria bacterium CG10_big_fil_rev_8_21_14_0_10_54_7]
MRIAFHRPMHLLLFLAVALLPLQAVAFEIPPNDGFVTDAAGILSPEEEQRLESLLSAYQAETTNEIAVVIVETTEGEPLMETAVEIGRLWGVGTKENDNGIILLISYADREMFLATGYGLEGVVPDIVAKGVIDREVTPHFRDGEFAAGIEAGVLALQKHIGGEYMPDRYAGFSSGFPLSVAFFFSIFGLAFLSAVVEGILIAFAPSRSWWAGGVVGLFLGILLTGTSGWWWSIPLLVIAGFIFDFIVSRFYHFDERFARWVHRRKKHRRTRWGGPRGGSFGGGHSGGGFSGGSFGGGGARGSW